MAQMLVCDLCQEIAEGTYPFGLVRLDNEMELCERHHAELADIVNEWAEYARRPGKAPATATKHRKLPAAFASSDAPWWLGPENKQLREDMRSWARDNGWPDLGDMGRIPAVLAAAFAEANKIDQRHRATTDDDDDDDDDAETDAEEPAALIAKPTGKKRVLSVAKRGA